MTDLKLDDASFRGEAGPSRIYSPDLKPLMQSLLALLADIDFEYECEREKLGSLRDDHLKKLALQKITERHRARREPYVQQLAILHSRIRSLSAS